MKSFRVRHRFGLQTLAFLTILTCSILLYLTAQNGPAACSWALLGILAGAMFLAMWIS